MTTPVGPTSPLARYGVSGGAQSLFGGTPYGPDGQPLLGGLASGNKYGDSSQIYLGTKSLIKEAGGKAGQGQFERRTGTGPNYVTAQEARGLPLQWMQNDPETLKKFVNTGVLNKIPGFDVGMGMPEIMSAWDDLLKASWAMNKYAAQSGKEFTPWDVMNSYSNESGKFGTVKRGDWLYDIATNEKIKYVGPKTKTSSQKKVDLSSTEDVRAIATNALAELLGRAPTQEELGQFRSSINALEEKNPLMATTTETLNDMGEVVSTETKQTGGLSAEARAMAVSDEAKQKPEYAKYQSGTTYWGALMQMMGGG